MKVGILGSGEVAQSLGSGFLNHGHTVVLGTRDPAKLSDWLAGKSGARVASVADAAAFGELVVLAVKGPVALDVLRAAGASSLTGKTVIDATNPIADAPPVNGVLSFFTTLDDSLLERLQREIPNARFVKAFNSVGSDLMVNPKLAGGPAFDVHLRKRRGREEDRDGDSRAVRLGDCGHGEGRGRPRHRAPLDPLVHPGVSPERMAARVQAPALTSASL